MRHVLLVMVMLLSGCKSAPTPAPEPNPTPPAVASTCKDACEHARKYDCPWAAPTEHGATCEMVCENAQELEPWALDCRSTAPSCEAAERCEQ